MTGATGYIGRHLCARQSQKGGCVRLSGAEKTIPMDAGSVRHFPWTMGENVPDEALAPWGEAGSPSVVIHLAHVWESDEADENVNLIAAGMLLDASRRAGVDKFILASSASARSDALNCYGRTKARIEGC